VIVDCNGKNVRVGIDAPAAVTVDRQEVHERRKQFRRPQRQPGRSLLPLGTEENERTRPIASITSGDSHDRC
jgi:hypothetical protein